MNSIQTCLFDMLAWLSAYMEEHHLKYYVVGGTMLGAVRHQGFIPWDDDIDIAMPREDYETLLQLLREPVDHYVAESVNSGNKDFYFSYAKLYDTNTTLVECSRTGLKRGLYIDIFPLDGIGNTMEESLRNYRSIDRMNMLLAMKTSVYRKGRKWWKNAAVFVGGFLPISRRWLARRMDRLCASRSFEEHRYVGHLMGVYRSREILERSVYGKPTPYAFEGMTVYGPEKYEEYLTSLYRDWRRLPPEDKRCTPHDFVEMDLNKPYRPTSSEAKSRGL